MYQQSVSTREIPVIDGELDLTTELPVGHKLPPVPSTTRGLRWYERASLAAGTGILLLLGCRPLGEALFVISQSGGH